MKYIVIDEMCGTERLFNKFSEANIYALSVQGVLFKTDEDGNRVFMLSYTD